MYTTTIHIGPMEPGESEFYDRLNKACERMDVNGTPDQATFIADMAVKRSFHGGISCTFDHLRLSYPIVFKQLRVVRVRILVPRWSGSGLINGRYDRRNSHAHVKDLNDRSRHCIDIEANTLRQAIRLFDDIVRGVAKVKLAYDD